MTNIGKPYEGKPHVRFDEEGLASPAFHSTFVVRVLPKTARKTPSKSPLTNSAKPAK